MPKWEVTVSYPAGYHRLEGIFTIKAPSRDEALMMALARHKGAKLIRIKSSKGSK